MGTPIWRMQTPASFSNRDITPLQEIIMRCIDSWVRIEKTPVPQKEIIIKMKKAGKRPFTVANALSGLLKKGYIRRAYTGTRMTQYVQLRGL